jgi:hypothetical protein
MAERISQARRMHAEMRWLKLRCIPLYQKQEARLVRLEATLQAARATARAQCICSCSGDASCKCGRNQQLEWTVMATTATAHCQSYSRLQNDG